MNKRTIRLNEGVLRRIVKESIKLVLNEMDWKTLDNAARKREAEWSKTYWSDDEDTKRKYKSYRNLLNGARDAFARDYGYSDEDGYLDSYIDDNTSDHSIGVTALRPDGKHFQTYAPYFITNQDFYGQNGSHEPGKWCVGTVGWAGAVSCSPDFDTPEEAAQYAHEHKMSLVPRDKISDKLMSKWKDANKELNRFYKSKKSDGTHGGDYEYQKGRGWRLKDGVE